MSPTWDWTSQIAGTAFTVVFRLLDWYVTKYRFPALGIDEDNDWVKDNRGGLSEAKFWILFALTMGSSWVVFLAFPETQWFDRAYCGPFAAIGGLASGVAYFSNLNLIKKVKARGGVPSAGVGVPGGTQR
jgi:Trk-type K+ transport system membrane component